MNDVRKIPSRAIGRVVAGGISGINRGARYLLRETGTMSRLASAQQRLARAVPDALGEVRDSYYRVVARNFYKADLTDLNEAQLTRAGRLLHADQQRAARLLRRMDTDEQRAFLNSNLADDVRTGFYDAWRGSSSVHATDVGAAVRRFDALDADDSARFRAILDDPDLRSSWVRAVGESGVETSQIRIALQRVDQVGDQHRIQRFLSARVANDQFVTRKLNEGVDDPVRPHKRNSIVIEYETSDTQTLYRLWDDTDPRSNMRGEWTTTGRVIDDADGFDELNDVLASPEGIEYNRIARVNVDEGTTIRMSTAGRNWGQNGGAVQTLLRDRVPSSNWDPLDGLSVVNP